MALMHFIDRIINAEGHCKMNENMLPSLKCLGRRAGAWSKTCQYKTIDSEETKSKHAQLDLNPIVEGTEKNYTYITKQS